MPPFLPHQLRLKKSIGEFEPFIVYFDPILTSLLSGPNRNVLLRWTNISSDETEDLRPDATISKIEQLDFGASLGFGEAKISHSTTTTDTHALCHELLRSATFSKDTIDHNSLQAALPLQIHGFHISFFITRLRYGGVYVMQEIGQLTFPPTPWESH